MKGWIRTIGGALALTLTLIFAMTAAARAEVMTIGVYFRGLVPQEDGSSRQVPLAGSFRVIQGGMDRGVIVAGETVVAVDGSEPVVLTPMAETIPAEQALGRICGVPTVACPPAIPIAVSGERIGPEALALFRHYGVRTVDVIKAR